MEGKHEPGNPMYLTLQLPPETEAKLQQIAARSGLSVERFVQLLVEKEIQGGNGTSSPPSPPRISTAFDEALAPFRQEVAASGMTDDELLQFFEEVREEVWREKHGRPDKTS
jgi:hypothetical protein